MDRNKTNNKTNSEPHDDANNADLTAYALGELDDAAKVAAIEKRIKKDPEIGQMVEEIRSTGDLLSACFEAEGTGEPQLSETDKTAIAAQLNGAMEHDATAGPYPIHFYQKTYFKVVAGILGAAACVMFVANVLLPQARSRRGSNEDQYAINTDEPAYQMRTGGQAAAPDAGRGGAVGGEEGMNSTWPAITITRPAVSEAEKQKQAGADLIARKLSSNGDTSVGMAFDYEGGDDKKLAMLKSAESVKDNLVGESVAQRPGVTKELGFGRKLQSRGRAGGGGKGGGGDVANAPAESTHGIEIRNRGVEKVDADDEFKGAPAFDADRILSEIPITHDYFEDKISSINEDYAPLIDNPFLPASENPLSTFSIDVDTASYTNIRRFITSDNSLPPRDSVRIEEMINYFDYAYTPPPTDAEHPFSVDVEIADCPWNVTHRLAKIGLQGYEVPADERPATNLVFLLDVSGSMSSHNKLPLLKSGMKSLVESLLVDDRVAIVTYAGSSQVVLDSTSVYDRDTIVSAIDRLGSGGSTNASAGINDAYAIAKKHYIEGGINRVILATDGDFNVGATSHGDLLSLIQTNAQSNVFLTVLGFGMGNYKDATLELLADKGNGFYAYIDTYDEAHKVLVEDLSSTLMTIAKDVKIQMEFNPNQVRSYRLIGYANRLLEARDFNDDTKDAGEIGAGHNVTALYEIIPTDADLVASDPATDEVDDLVYQESEPQLTDRATESGELFTLKLRYKKPESDTSQLMTFAIADDGKSINDASDDFRFASAIASFGMMLRLSEHAGDMTFAHLLDLAESGRLESVASAESDRRNEFISLIRSVKRIAPRLVDARMQYYEALSAESKVQDEPHTPNTLDVDDVGEPAVENMTEDESGVDADGK